MRRLGLLLLICSVSLADRLDEVASTQFVGSQVDIAAIAVGNGDYLPSILSQRVEGRGHWRSVSLGLSNVDQGKLDGPAVGMARQAGGVVYVWLQDNQYRALGLTYEGRRTSPTNYGGVRIGAPNARLISIGSLRTGPLLVFAHDHGLELVALDPRGRGHSDLIPTKGDSVAATEPFTMRDGRTSMFVAAPGRLMQLVQAGEAFTLAGETPLGPDGFVPHAIAIEGPELCIAGQRGARAVLLRLDLRNVAAPGVPIDVGAGVIEKLRFLGPREVAVAGTKDGRAWAGVVALGPRPGLVHEAFVRGGGVTALAVNPARRGWSLAVATTDASVALLRLPGDPELPRGWDPFAPPPEPPAVPLPEPEAQPEPAEEALPPVQAGGHASFAVLPRAEAHRGTGVDTEIVLINLGQQRSMVMVRFVADEGRGGFARVVLEPGKRTKLSLGETLFRRRLVDFDGYVRVDGADRDTIVVDAVIRRQGQAPEEVRPHWR